MDVPFLDLAAASRELRRELHAAVCSVVDSGWYIGGEEVERFEHSFAEYCGVRNCVGVSNGLEALELTLRAWGIGGGDEVIVPSHTFIASWLAVSSTGATVVPVEVEPHTGLLEAATVVAAITSRTRAVMPVHLYGQLCDMEEMRSLADAHGLRLLEDAAQAHGARRHGRHAGSLGDAACFSFYPGKNLGALGDAGAVVTNDDATADRLRVLRNYGSEVRYHNMLKGRNARLDPMQAAALGVKLAHLDDWNSRRQSVAARYDEAFDAAAIQRIQVRDREAMSYHLYVLLSDDRDALQLRLRSRGVQTLIHYPLACHLQPAYAELGLGVGSFPVAEMLAARVLSLPIGPHLSDSEVEHVVAAVVSEACR
jgi:dTDP-4-amino-4,6-dideoxygalactose transaminase